MKDEKKVLLIIFSRGMLIMNELKGSAASMHTSQNQIVNCFEFLSKIASSALLWVTQKICHRTAHDVLNCISIQFDHRWRHNSIYAEPVPIIKVHKSFSVTKLKSKI